MIEISLTVKEILMQKKTMWVAVVLIVIVAATVWYFTPNMDEKYYYLKSTRSRLDLIGQAINQFKDDHKKYPSSEEGLRVLALGDSYIRSRAMLDAWKHPFVYHETPNEKHPFELYSVGPNGVDEHMSGDDIEYWSEKEDKEVRRHP
jgi:hypothetical protein